MITLECEVVEPKSYDVAGKEINIAGVKTTSYYVTKIVGDEKGTADAQERAAKVLTNLGLDTSTLNWDNLKPQLDPLRGKVILTQMSAQTEERTKTPTASEIEAGKALGKNVNQIKGAPMLHPVTGKQLTRYWPKIDEIFGLATDGHVNMPY
jgi:hypothetical protein